MSKPSGRSSKTSRTRSLPPFGPALLTKAREIVHGYRLVIERTGRSGYVGRTVELPGVLGFGPTPQDCVESTLRTQSFEVATLLERSEPLPLTASQRRRTVQLNIRVSGGEKLRFEQAANARGFRSVSDFVRDAALEASQRVRAPARAGRSKRSA